jgi:hypothetical protein
MFILPNSFEVFEKGGVEIVDSFLEPFLSDIHSPGTPIFLLRVHSQDLHFPEGMD